MTIAPGKPARAPPGVPWKENPSPSHALRARGRGKGEGLCPRLFAPFAPFRGYFCFWPRTSDLGFQLSAFSFLRMEITIETNVATPTAIPTTSEIIRSQASTRGRIET